jgi:hypothetical protein
MIALAADCILLRRKNGESEPVNSQAISIEVLSDGQPPFDEDFIKEASTAVLHYFKNEEGRDSVTLGEFAEALEKVLAGFCQTNNKADTEDSRHIVEADLQGLVADTAFELTFFTQLRAELRTYLRLSPQVLRFRGLRNCVLRLTGARRWTARCEHLSEQIVAYLRECLATESQCACALLVE